MWTIEGAITDGATQNDDSDSATDSSNSERKKVKARSISLKLEYNDASIGGVRVYT